MTRVLMLVQSGVLDDARVRKEAETLIAAGHQVTIIGSARPGSTDWDTQADLRFVSNSARPSDRPSSLAYRAIRWLLLPEHRALQQRRYRKRAVGMAAGIAFDVIHCHDYPTLRAGFALAGDRPIVYDSHECWSGRLRRGRPEPLRRFRQRRDEARLARRSSAVLTVSNELADWMRRRFRVAAVHVVRNTFPAEEFRSQSDRPVGLVYAGRVSPGRDLETAFAAELPADVSLSLAGPVEPGYVIPKHAHYSGVLPVDDIPGLLAANGLALVPLEDSCLNHEFALPNKVFQAVSAGVPVVASDLPALGRLVTEHGIGTLFEPGNPTSLGEAVERAIAGYQELTANVAAARESLNWSNDAEVLLSVYRGLSQ